MATVLLLCLHAYSFFSLYLTLLASVPFFIIPAYFPSLPLHIGKHVLSL